MATARPVRTGDAPYRLTTPPPERDRNQRRRRARRRETRRVGGRASDVGTIHPRRRPTRRRGRTAGWSGRARHQTYRRSFTVRTSEVLEEGSDLLQAVGALGFESADQAPHGPQLRQRCPGRDEDRHVGQPSRQRIVEGCVDLLVEAPEGLVVVDYKTDTLASEADVDAKERVRRHLAGPAGA